MKTFEKSANDLGELIMTRFADNTASDHYNKLLEELEELKGELEAGTYIGLATELADCIGCLIAIGLKSGISVNGLTAAFIAKTNINLKREWTKNENGTYSHVKSLIS